MTEEEEMISRALEESMVGVTQSRKVEVSQRFPALLARVTFLVHFLGPSRIF